MKKNPFTTVVIESGSSFVIKRYLSVRSETVFLDATFGFLSPLRSIKRRNQYGLLPLRAHSLAQSIWIRLDEN